MWRSSVYLFLLGAGLLTLALVVRSGIFEVRTHDEPINAAMRQALSQEEPELSEQDARLIDQLYPTALVRKSRLRYLIRAQGTGRATPKVGDTVTVHYTGQLLGGAPIDSSYQGGANLTFEVGTGQVIKGWDEMLLRMRKGERVTLIVPYWLGYGLEGRPPTIPPKATLVFDLKLLDFQRGGKAQ